MKRMTFSIVWRRCSMTWISQLAAFSLVEMNSLLDPWNFDLSAATSRYAFASRSLGSPVSFTKTRYSPPTLSTMRSGIT